MFEPWQMREMRPCPRQIREICSCARAAAGLEGAAGAGRGPAQNTLQTTQSQWLRPASIAGQSAHERARSAPRKNWGICAFPRNFRPVGANARNLAARANPRNLGAVSPPYYPPRVHYYRNSFRERRKQGRKEGEGGKASNGPNLCRLPT